MLRRLLLFSMVGAGTLALGQSSSPPETPAPQQPSSAPAPTPNTSQQKTTDPNDPASPDWKGDKPQKPSFGQRVKDGLTSVPCIHIGAGGCMNETPQTRPPDIKSKPKDESEQQADKRPGYPGANQPMPRSDQQRSLNEDGESSSRTTIVDLSPPKGDATNHPESSTDPNGDVTELHAWDPHRSVKDVEVGDFYFTRDNYRAAESRYQEALAFKDNNAEAMYKLALTEEKLNRPDEARKYYALYLKTLPNGEHADEVGKALARLGPAQNAQKQ